MKTNYHTHTTRCMHAVGDDEDYVRSAIKGGFQELGFSDHGPWKYHTDFVSDIRMLPEDLPEYIESIRALKEKYRNQISIKIGLEYEYFPEYIHWLKEIIKEYRLDYILFGNHHYHTDEKFPYFGHHTTNRDMLDLYEESTIEGMESGLLPTWHIRIFLCVPTLNLTNIVSVSAAISVGQQPDFTSLWNIISAM